MRTMLVVLLSLCLIGGIAIAKPAEKPATPYTPNGRAVEVEPNDDFATANALTAGDDMSAAIDVGEDFDYFAIALTMGDIVTFETHPGDCDTQINLYGPAPGYDFIEFDDDDGWGLYSLIENYEVPADGTYFVSVNEYSATGTGPYILTATLEEPPPPPPVNSTCDGAIDLQEQGLIQFATNNCSGGNNYSPTNGCTGWAANGEEVTYKIDLAVGEVFMVALTDETYDASLYMLADCDDMDSCVAGGDDPEEFSWTCDVAGTYYLIVDGYSGCGEALVTIDAPIANDDMDWGTVKALFR